MGEMNRRLAHGTQGLDDAERGAVWAVYDEYEIVGGHVEGRGERHVYRPLREYPSLFAEFARLDIPDDEDGQAKVALAWASKYGVLGLESEPPRTLTAGVLITGGRLGSELDEFTVSRAREDRDSIAAFGREAQIAADVLATYRAAMNPTRESRHVIERMDVYELHRPESGDERASSFWTEWGLSICAGITQIYISKYCRPTLYRRDDRFGRWFGFDNLLGAMWLQMYLALTAEDDELRCLNPRCPKGNLPLPKRDKHDVGRPRKYCSTSCKNQAAQIRRRSGHAKTRSIRPRDASAKSADDEFSGFRHAIQNARDAVIRGD
jgi:hypothetical protein